LEIDSIALEEVFNEIDSIGINAHFYAVLENIDEATNIILDALTQIVNIHIYASYDPSFEVVDNENFYEIIHLNMTNKLDDNVLEALHSWIDDIVMNLAIGAICLDRFIKDHDEDKENK